MEIPTLEQIKKIYEVKGYKLFDDGVPYNLNIGGIRTNDMRPNTFNDYEFCFYKDETGEEQFHVWEATTDPGLYYLMHPLYKKGTAILAPGQYIGCWQVGLHKGKYRALIQIGGEVKVYRDANRDEKYNYDEATAEWGYFGINDHRASKYGIVNYVNRFSAGCQVIRDPNNFDELMTITSKSLNYFSNSFSYTLTIQDDFAIS